MLLLLKQGEYFLKLEGNVCMKRWGISPSIIWTVDDSYACKGDLFRVDFQVKPFLDQIAHILPFKAIAVDQKTLLAMKKLEELKEERNLNPYTYKYLIMNQMCGSQNWVKPIDRLYFGKYV